PAAEEVVEFPQAVHDLGLAVRRLNRGASQQQPKQQRGDEKSSHGTSPVQKKDRVCAFLLQTPKVGGWFRQRVTQGRIGTLRCCSLRRRALQQVHRRVGVGGGQG